MHKGVDVFAKKGTRVNSATCGNVLMTAERGKGGWYYITCHIYKDHSVVTYHVDEFEGNFTTLLGFATIALSAVWGLKLINATIISTIRNRREK